jgi:hypothetical protein
MAPDTMFAIREMRRQERRRTCPDVDTAVSPARSTGAAPCHLGMRHRGVYLQLAAGYAHGYDIRLGCAADVKKGHSNGQVGLPLSRNVDPGTRRPSGTSPRRRQYPGGLDYCRWPVGAESLRQQLPWVCQPSTPERGGACGYRTFWGGAGSGYGPSSTP